MADDTCIWYGFADDGKLLAVLLTPQIVRLGESGLCKSPLITVESPLMSQPTPPHRPVFWDRPHRDRGAVSCLIVLRNSS